MQGAARHLLGLATALVTSLGIAAEAGATVYYVSSSSGDDNNNGTSTNTPFQTLSKIDTLNLSPGDEVRLFCGDIWRGENLILDDSGTLGNPVVITSHPVDCQNQPVVSGAQPIVGWQLDSGNVYRADLQNGGNAGRFAGGINQLFSGEERLPYGRWPNLGTANGGYSLIDGQAGATITDNELPPGDWTGAYIQHRAQLWYLLRREVTGTSGTTLTLNQGAICQDGCVDWGYFLNRHRNTLDSDGEWYYDHSSGVVYLVSNSGPPADDAIEGSVLGAVDPEDQAGVILGGDFPEWVEHVVVDNLDVRRWAGNGIQMARLLQFDQDKNITIKNNSIIDVAGIGIRLTTFVFDSQNGPDGLRGGPNGLIQDNLIDGANIDGISLYSVDTVVERNNIRNIGLLPNLTEDGLGCLLTGNSCGIHAVGIRLLVSDEMLTGNGNTIRLNTLEDIGWTGIDIWGPNNLVEHNVIHRPAVTIAEGAGVRVFGGGDFATSPAHDITIRGNVVRDSRGIVDGVPPPRDHAWGFGINIDHYADNVTVENNTVADCTAFGLIYSLARGTVTGNNLWNNTTGTSGVAEIRLLDTTAQVSLTNNRVYVHRFNRPSLSVDFLSNLTTADNNYYISPYDPRLVRASELQETPYTLLGWQSVSGFDLNSRQAWYGLEDGEPDVSVLFVNETDSSMAIPLGQTYVDLDQNPVSGTLDLGPFSSVILIEAQEIVFSDGFKSGDTTLWSSTVMP
jgi:hypothetical protein